MYIDVQQAVEVSRQPVNELFPFGHFVRFFGFLLSDSDPG